MKTKRINPLCPRGQAATEYMMLVSVAVVAVVGAAYAFVPTFQTGVQELSLDVKQILIDHGSTRGGFGLAASNAAGSGNTITSGQASRAGIGGGYNVSSNSGE